MRRLSVLALSALLLPLAGAAGEGDPVRIAVIDTGIDASHPEFRAGQVVAWRDFTAEASATPQDGHGHGTATASLVAGLNLGSCGTRPKISFAPGADLIIARVGTDEGTISGNIEAAFDWARLQGADVITMSIGAIVPGARSNSAAIDRAAAAGILVVVSAGNGVNNFGLAPYPGWLSSYGNNKEALVVGAANIDGQATTSTTGNSDPDVVSWGDSVCVARANTQNYTLMSGTSFSAPLVAGMGGALAQIARDNGQEDGGTRLRALLENGATNNPIVPYHREGLGHLIAAEFNALKPHAAAGTIPLYSQAAWAQADKAYHDELMATVRS